MLGLKVALSWDFLLDPEALLHVSYLVALPGEPLDPLGRRGLKSNLIPPFSLSWRACVKWMHACMHACMCVWFCVALKLCACVSKCTRVRKIDFGDPGTFHSRSFQTLEDWWMLWRVVCTSLYSGVQCACLCTCVRERQIDRVHVWCCVFLSSYFLRKNLAQHLRVGNQYKAECVTDGLPAPVDVPGSHSCCSHMHLCRAERPAASICQQNFFGWLCFEIKNK